MQGSLLTQSVALNVTVLQTTQFNHWMVVSKLSWKPLAPKPPQCKDSRSICCKMLDVPYHVCFTGYWWRCEVDMSLKKMSARRILGLINSVHGRITFFCMCFGCVCVCVSMER